MSLSINTNIAALISRRSMLSNSNAMNSSLERLSSGLRINTAADDASGMTIADSLKSQYLGIGQGIQNANDGVSVVQTADGALEESVNIVRTIKTKAIQAASDTQTADTRAAIQDDIDKLLEELDNIAKTTSYNGQQLLNGTYTNKVIKTGESVNATTSISIDCALSTDIGHISTSTLELENEEGGDVKLAVTSTITGEEVELETVTIDPESNDSNQSMAALADEINSVTGLTGITAEAIVQSTTSMAVQSGQTSSDFSINGITIGSVIVQDHDSSAALVTAINDKTTQTGVSAAINDDGTLTLTSVDGRAINQTGNTGDVLGNDDMSTIGYIFLTQEGSGNFNIESILEQGTGETITLNADYTVTGTTTLSQGSIIAAGSTIAAGTVIGGEAEVSGYVVQTASEYELEAGSTLAANTILVEGTVISGKIIVSGDTAAGNEDTVQLDEEMSVSAESTLSSGTVLGDGTVLTMSFTNGSQTYEAGSTLSRDLTLTQDLFLISDITLSEDSAVAAGSTLAAGTELGADMEIGSTWDTSEETLTSLTGAISTDVILESTLHLGIIHSGETLEAGSVLAAGTSIGGGDYNIIYDGPTIETDQGILASGSTLASGTTYTILEDQRITQDLDLSILATNTSVVLGAGTSLEEGSNITTQVVSAGDWATVTSTEVTLIEKMSLEEGSTIVPESTLAAGSTLGDNTQFAEFTITEETELAAGSTLFSGSIVAKDSYIGNLVTVNELTLDEEMTLNIGSTLKAGTVLEAGTIVRQDITAQDGNGNTVELSAGSTVPESLTLTSDIILSGTMTLSTGSTIATGSELMIDTNNGSVTIYDQDNLILADINVLTQEDATVAIRIAEIALSDLDSIRSSIGSVQNQLSSSISNMSVTKNNVKASESVLRDVDFAEETANYAKLSVLAQTCSYALAQANTYSSNLTSLLE